MTTWSFEGAAIVHAARQGVNGKSYAKGEHVRIVMHPLSDGRLVLPDRSGAFEAPHEGGLEDVLGQGAVAETLLQEGQEASVVLDEGSDHLGLGASERVDGIGCRGASHPRRIAGGSPARSDRPPPGLASVMHGSHGIDPFQEPSNASAGRASSEP
jgi:hypothetical protein